MLVSSVPMRKLSQMNVVMLNVHLLIERMKTGQLYTVDFWMARIRAFAKSIMNDVSVL